MTCTTAGSVPRSASLVSAGMAQVVKAGALGQPGPFADAFKMAVQVAPRHRLANLGGKHTPGLLSGERQRAARSACWRCPCSCSCATRAADRGSVRRAAARSPPRTFTDRYYLQEQASLSRLSGQRVGHAEAARLARPAQWFAEQPEHTPVLCRPGSGGPCRRATAQH